jgi:hypothetical protein
MVRTGNLIVFSYLRAASVTTLAACADVTSLSPTRYQLTGPLKTDSNAIYFSIVLCLNISRPRCAAFGSHDADLPGPLSKVNKTDPN